MSAPFPTMLRPPPRDENRAPIENDLDVTELTVLGPDIFTNTREMWHPPGARGIYGGSVIAMCQAAGQKTVSPEFSPHSCHCYFLLAGNSDIPVLFHVERVRDGRSYVTRTVQARQRGRCIFTITMSFVRTASAAGPGSSSVHPLPSAPSIPTRIVAPGDAYVHHAAAMPATRPPVPPDNYDAAESLEASFTRAIGRGELEHKKQPVLAGPMVIVGGHDAPPHMKKTQQWVRVRGKISEGGGRAAHLNALAYLTDRYFIGTICRIHRMWRFPVPVRALLGEEGESGDDDSFMKSNPEMVRLIREYIEFEGGGIPLEEYRDRPTVGMLVSLDHTIYFHQPEQVQADEWMLAEMESPWAGEGRGVVTQRIFSRDGTLLATCMQEGILRLKREEKEEPKKETKAKI